MRILAARLEAPVQSWGEGDAWNMRSTERFPTLTAVTGMIGAAMGIGRKSPELDKICRSLHMAAREDRAGTIREEFGIISDQKCANETAKPPSFVQRSYLQNAVYTVALASGNDALLDKIRDAFLAPVFRIYLGRKECVPSVPVIWMEAEAKSPVDFLEKTMGERNECLCCVEQPHPLRMDGSLFRGIMVLENKNGPGTYEHVIKIPAGSDIARNITTDVVAAHVFVQSLLHEERQSGRTQFAVREKDDAVKITIRTTHKKLKESPPAPAQAESSVKNIKTDYKEGQKLRFDITLNTSRKRNGKREQIRPGGSGGAAQYHEQEQWFVNKALEWGFKVTRDNLHVIGSKRKTGVKEKKRISYESARFTGRLKVTDPELFKKSLENGIGSEKAYGAGLLFVEG